MIIKPQTDLTFGMFDLSHELVSFGPANPPVFTAQPSAYVFFQRTGKLDVTGADATGADSLVWQKQNADTTWSDVAAQTGKTISVTNAGAEWGGVFRLKATNAAGASYSNTVKIGDVYLYIQNDADASNANGTGTVQTGPTTYTEDGPSGARYYSAFIREASTNANITPADYGLTSARAKLGQNDWVSSNGAVIVIKSVSAAGQLTVTLGMGNATLTANFGNLQSVLTATVSR